MYNCFKIVDSCLKIIKLVSMLFEMIDKEKKSQFFEEIFLITKLGINIALKMPFLKLSNVKNNFLKLKLF